MDPILAVILLIVGSLVVLGAIWKRNAISSFAGSMVSKIGLPKTIGVLAIGGALVFFAVGAGAWGTIQNFGSGLLAPAAVAGGEVGAVPMERVSCLYSASDTVNETAITLRASTQDSTDLYVTIDNSSLHAADGDLAVSTDDIINITYDCDRLGDIGEDASVEIVVKGDTFRSELSTTDVGIYNIIETSTIPSPVFDDRYTQTVRVNDGAVATSSSPKERNYLTFAEGDKRLTLGVHIDLDDEAFEELALGSTSDVKIYQRVGGQDELLATVFIDKIA